MSGGGCLNGAISINAVVFRTEDFEARIVFGYFMYSSLKQFYWNFLGFLLLCTER